jgi:hypothetical protein
MGQVLAYRSHRNKWLVSFAAPVTTLMFIAYYVIPSSILLQIALLGLVAASIWQVIEARRCAKCAPAPL